MFYPKCINDWYILLLPVKSEINQAVSLYVGKSAFGIEKEVENKT